jgi:hypothetical protein
MYYRDLTDLTNLKMSKNSTEKRISKLYKEFAKGATIFYRVYYCENDNTDFLAQSLDELREYLNKRATKLMDQDPDEYESLEDAIESMLENNICERITKKGLDCMTHEVGYCDIFPEVEESEKTKKTEGSEE